MPDKYASKFHTLPSIIHFIYHYKVTRALPDIKDLTNSKK